MTRNFAILHNTSPLEKAAANWRTAWKAMQAAHAVPKGNAWSNMSPWARNGIKYGAPAAGLASYGWATNPGQPQQGSTLQQPSMVGAPPAEAFQQNISGQPTQWVPPQVTNAQPAGKSFMGIEEGGLADFGLSVLPGVGTVYSGSKAIRDFANGNIMSGLGNTAWAAMGLIPFAGAAAKGLGRLAAKGTGMFARGAGHAGRAAQGVSNTLTGGKTLASFGNPANPKFTIGARGLATQGGLMAAGTGAAALDTSDPVQQWTQQQQAPIPEWYPQSMQWQKTASAWQVLNSL